METRHHIKNGVIRKSLRVGKQNYNQMKKYLMLLLFGFIFSTAFTQKNYQDVVYLKNGSIIHGLIIEQIPDKSIKIETADNNIFVFQKDEIEKLTKEPVNNAPIPQNTAIERRGYIGCSVGPSIPIGKFADKNDGAALPGAQINLVNIGYLFTDNFGVAATWFGAAYPVDFEGIDPWGCGGMMIGPLLSLPISNKLKCDARAMIGYSVISFPDVAAGVEQASSSAFQLGGAFRYNVHKKVSFSVNLDYFSTEPNFKNYNVKQEIEAITLSFGINYRIK